MANNFKDKLKAKRERYTQAGIAKKFGVRQSYVSMIANGEREAKSEKAKQIKKALSRI